MSIYEFSSRMPISKYKLLMNMYSYKKRTGNLPRKGCAVESKPVTIISFSIYA